MKNINEIKLRELVDSGLTNKEIALILNVSRSTVVRSKTLYGLRSKFSIKKHEIKKCLHCKSEFDCLKIENRIFCSHSCSATYTNIERSKSPSKYEGLKMVDDCVVKNCENCKSEFKINSRNFSKHKYKKYCSVKCHKEFEEKIRFDKVENSEIIVSSKMVKFYLIKKHGNKCMECGWCSVNPTSGKVPIELEHIDGNSENNKLENLKLLCPNCHSLTPTYKALNRGNGRHKRMERYNEDKSY